MSNKVIRLDEARAKRDVVPVADYTQVPIIACSGCGKGAFSLTHDGRVVCQGCCHVIEPIRWIGTTGQGPAA